LAETTRGIGPPLHQAAKRAETEARHAIELDPRSAIAHAMLAWTFGHQGNWDPALEAADTAIALNANDPWGYLSKGHNLVYSGRPMEARDPLAKALRLDPLGPTALTVLHQYAVGCYFDGDYNAAEATARRSIRDYPENPRPHLVFAASLGQLGRGEAAATALDAAIAASPSIFAFITNSRPTYYRPQDHEHLLNGLRKAGWQC
jgi:tetratricopeptide (TPR) repeat protein